MDDAKLFARFLLAVFARHYEKDAEVTVEYINENVFNNELDAESRRIFFFFFD